MIRQDDRTPEQRTTHTWLAIGTDTFMSGWGGAEGGNSFAAWACDSWQDAKTMTEHLERRGDMQRVRIEYDDPKRPYRPGRTCAHLHIYLADLERAKGWKRPA